eukprot:scaffold205310_cov13-Tisochrysis_lutea.AAC.1
MRIDSKWPLFPRKWWAPAMGTTFQSGMKIINKKLNVFHCFALIWFGLFAAGALDKNEGKQITYPDMPELSALLQSLPGYGCPSFMKPTTYDNHPASKRSTREGGNLETHKEGPGYRSKA